MAHSPVMAVVGGTYTPVKRDMTAQTCNQTHDCHVYAKPTQKKRMTYDSYTSTQSIILLRACGNVYVYVNHGVRYSMRSGSCARLVVIPRSYESVLTQLGTSSALSLIPWTDISKPFSKGVASSMRPENAHHQANRQA